MKVWVSLGIALLFVASVSRAEPSAKEAKAEELKGEIIKKIADLGADADPLEVQGYLQELDGVMGKELPKDPDLRQFILKNIYQNIVEGQAQGQGQGQLPGPRVGAPDPFQKVPSSR